MKNAQWLVVLAATIALGCSAEDDDSTPLEVANDGAENELKSGGGGIVSCNTKPSPEHLWTITSARNVSCSDAAKVARQYKDGIRERFDLDADYKCAQTSGALPGGGAWRCATANTFEEVKSGVPSSQNEKAFRFAFAD